MLYPITRKPTITMNLLWNVQLLGGLRARQSDTTLTRFRTKKTGALLGFLAHHKHKAWPREEIIDQLWPDALDNGPNHLSLALSSLRHQLEPPGVERGTVLRADRGSVQLNPTACTTDVAVFEAGLDTAAKTSGDEQARWLHDAIALYAGPLLSGYDELWIVAEQQRLQERFFQAVRQLVAHLEQAGERDQALQHARRAVQVDPLHEEANYELIRLLAATGQSAAAVRHYHDFAYRLKQEMDDMPSEATVALLRQLKRRPEVVGEETSKYASGSAHMVLPGGVVTCLLIDIPPAAAGAQPASPAPKTRTGYRRRLRTEWQRHGGHVAQQTSRASAIVFADVEKALACALACQRVLRPQTNRSVETDPSASVRLCLHSGEMASGNQGVGVIEQAIRLKRAARGGQIVCSETAAARLPPDALHAIAPGIELTRLGAHRLPPTPAEIALFLVHAPDIPAYDLGLAATGRTQGGKLPLSLTRFFGREAEIVRLRALLLPEQTRLVTLVGPAGIGKTRLGLETARRLAEPFGDSVWLVPLADLSEPGRIADAILDTLGVPRTPPSEPLAQAIAALGARTSLLVLDNFEHLINDGTRVVQQLLEQVPTLTCLVTSRQLLGLDGERAFPVEPLPVPEKADTPERLSRSESVQLFVDRAQAVRPDFQITNHNAPAIAKLCAGLEGIPLALELAASRAQVLTPFQMLGQMERRFDLLVGRKRGTTERHRTLRAAVDWSYQLLSPELQRFFARLSVFRGGWTLEAAQAVSGEPLALDYLAQLRECSLVLAEEATPSNQPEMRFSMLETLREYSQDRLAELEEVAATRSRHLRWCVDLAERAAPQLEGGEQVQWLARLEQEHENLRAALDWALEQDATVCLHLAGSLGRFFEVKGHWAEGRAWLEQALAHTANETRMSPPVRAQALARAGDLARHQGDYPSASASYEQALAVAQEASDKQSIASLLNSLGHVVFSQSDYMMAHTFYTEALAFQRQLGDKKGVVLSLNGLGN